jgi:hypothetical protein
VSIDVAVVLEDEDVAGGVADQRGDVFTNRAVAPVIFSDLDAAARGELATSLAFTEQAPDMVATNKARDAFDVSKEPAIIQEKYGKGTEFLQARRLVEAGVPVVTLTPRNRNPGSMCNGEWEDGAGRRGRLILAVNDPWVSRTLRRTSRLPSITSSGSIRRALSPIIRGGPRIWSMSGARSKSCCSYPEASATVLTIPSLMLPREVVSGSS